MSESDVLRLRAYFIPIEEWNREDVFFFGNTQLLLPKADIYKISKSLFSDLSYHEQPNRTYSMSVATLINAIFVLVKKQDFDHAYSLFKSVKSLDFTDELTFEKLKINYLETLFYYLNTNDIEAMNRFLKSLEDIGLNEEAASFRLGFSQFKKISSK